MFPDSKRAPKVSVGRENKMKKLKWAWLGLGAWLLVGMVACEEDKDYSPGQGEALSCGQGQQVQQSCVYESSLIIEGFLCPPDLPVRHDFQGFAVCAANEQLPEDLLDDLGDAGFTPMELPPAAPGQVCQQPGARVEASDGCNSCQCDGGAWSCTEIACQEPGDNNGDNNMTGLVCGADGTFAADDGCNTCQCLEEDGFVGAACTEIGCPQQCDPGDSFDAEDGCSCQCDNSGHWQCNPVGCMQTLCEEGVNLPAGDGCNTCQCMNGVWSCTRLACQ